MAKSLINVGNIKKYANKTKTVSDATDAGIAVLAYAGIWTLVEKFWTGGKALNGTVKILISGALTWLTGAVTARPGVLTAAWALSANHAVYSLLSGTANTAGFPLWNTATTALSLPAATTSGLSNILPTAQRPYPYNTALPGTAIATNGQLVNFRPAAPALTSGLRGFEQTKESYTDAGFRRTPSRL
ncbi:MAG: hypothetical protein NT007_09570 [Candidatus Kapabacteria bacterium]|nr:hypothetical protein [Candidatus Kapabacteria bacterium]